MKYILINKKLICNIYIIDIFSNCNMSNYKNYLNFSIAFSRLLAENSSL